MDDEEEVMVGSSGKFMFVESKERKEVLFKLLLLVVLLLVELEWDFVVEMKKFIYGFFNKGKVGILWYSLLLCCCCDLDKELSIRKVFNVFGVLMYNFFFDFFFLLYLYLVVNNWDEFVLLKV